MTTKATLRKKRKTAGKHVKRVRFDAEKAQVELASAERGEEIITAKNINRLRAKKGEAMAVAAARNRDVIYDLVAEGVAIAQIAEGLKLTSAVVTSELNKDHSRYMQARFLRAHSLTDQMLMIADDSSRDAEGDAIMRDKLKIDVRKWLASKLLPSHYGDEMSLEFNNQGGSGVGAILAAIDGSSSVVIEG